MTKQKPLLTGLSKRKTPNDDKRHTYRNIAPESMLSSGSQVPRATDVIVTKAVKLHV